MSEPSRVCRVCRYPLVTDQATCPECGGTSDGVELPALEFERGRSGVGLVRSLGELVLRAGVPWALRLRLNPQTGLCGALTACSLIVVVCAILSGTPMPGRQTNLATFLGQSALIAIGYGAIVGSALVVIGVFRVSRDVGKLMLYSFAYLVPVSTLFGVAWFLDYMRLISLWAIQECADDVIGVPLAAIQSGLSFVLIAIMQVIVVGPQVPIVRRLGLVAAEAITYVAVFQSIPWWTLEVALFGQNW